jgi:pre-mRNA-processing factor 40
LLIVFQRALSQSPWKEYSSPDGRKYWHNAETNKTTWEMPEVYKAAQSQAQPHLHAQPQLKPQAPYAHDSPSNRTPYLITFLSTFVAGGVAQLQDPYRRDPRDDQAYQNNERPGGYGTGDSYRSSAIPQHEQDYSSAEEAESVFHKLLRRSGVQSDWSWEQTVRTVAKDPHYRAVKDPKDRRMAFERYIAEVRSQEKDREKERQAKLRADFYSMLRSHPEIHYYTRWKTAQAIIQGETIYRTAKSSDEAQSLFEEYRSELFKAHSEAESSRHKSALDRLTQLLQSLDLEPYTRWSEVQNVLKANAAFQGDQMFKSISKLDMLKAFESHIKALERSFNDKRQKQKSMKARKERQNRDRFIGLLRELRTAGKLKASTKWKDFRELIKDDPRYVAMLGQPGSSPLDLFWDMVEEEDRVLRSKRNDALDVLEVSALIQYWQSSN